MNEDTVAQVRHVLETHEVFVENAIGIAMSDPPSSPAQAEARIREARRVEANLLEIHEGLVNQAAREPGEPWASLATRTGDSLRLLQGYLLTAAMSPAARSEALPS